MNPRDQPIDLTASETSEFEAVQAGEHPAREAEPAHGVPSWDPDEGDFS